MFKCKCGFESKSKAGLVAHQRKCKVMQNKKEFVIVDGGNIVRTYSVEVHGKKAGELAKMFVSKFTNCKIK